MEKVLLFFPFYTQSYNRLRVFKTFFLSLLLIPKNYSIYISGIICTLKFCTLETSRDILSHLWSLNMRKSCYKTCFPRSCKIVKERNPFKFFYHIYAITRLSTSQQQAKARQKFTKIILFKLKWYIFLIIVIFPPNTVHVRRQTLWFWRWYLTLRGEHDYLYFVSCFFFSNEIFHKSLIFCRSENRVAFNLKIINWTDKTSLF